MCPNTDATTVSHRFPRKRDLAQKWQHSLRLSHIDLDLLLQKFVVCTKHFQRTDYRNALSKHLNYTAVPRVEPSPQRTYSRSGSDVDNDVLEVNMENVGNEQRHRVVNLCIVDDRHRMVYEYDDGDLTTIEATAVDTNSITQPEDLNFEEYITETTDNGNYAMDTSTTAAVCDGVSVTYLTHVTAECTKTSNDPRQLSNNIEICALGVDLADTNEKASGMQQQRFVEQIDLPNSLLVSAAVSSEPEAVDNDDDEEIETGSADQHSDITDSYVYVLEMNMPDVGSTDASVGSHHHAVCSNVLSLPNVLLSGDDCSQDSMLGADVKLDQQPPLLATTDEAHDARIATSDTNTSAISSLLSALIDNDLAPPSISGTGATSAVAADATATVDYEEEPYALHDTVEVRLYNEMSKRSLIQLLVAANGRIRDLEQRLGTIESAHNKVLSSLELFRSILKR